MDRMQLAALIALRTVLGWFFFYAGITKVLDPSWSAAGFLGSAKTFPALYAFFAAPELLPSVNILNAWGLTLIGTALLLGIGVRIASGCGALMMLLYYFPALTFPYIGAHSFLIDEHIVYLCALLVLLSSARGMPGLGAAVSEIGALKRYPNVRSLFL